MERKVNRMFLQKMAGFVLLIVSAIIIFMGFQGVTPEDSDVTPVLITIPLGVFLLRTKECVIY